MSGLCGHTQTLSENCIYALALAATRKRQTALELLVQTHSPSSKSVMVSMGVSKLGPMDRIFINEDQWRILEVRCFSLTSYRLSCVRSVASYLPEGNVPAHRARETINLLKRETCIHYTRPFATK